MIAPFFIAGFDTPSDLCCRIRLYNKGLCPLIPEFIALGFRRSKKEQHQVLLLQTSNNNYGWNKYHAGIFGEVNSTPYPCKSKFQSEVWDNWNLIFQLTTSSLWQIAYQRELLIYHIYHIKSKWIRIANTTTANITHPNGNNIFSANQSAKLFFGVITAPISLSRNPQVMLLPKLIPSTLPPLPIELFFLLYNIAKEYVKKE